MFTGNLQLDLGKFSLNSGAFEFESQGVTVLFGRSGSGKSTLLRAMSGLDKRTVGQLRFGEEVWQDDLGRLRQPRRERQAHGACRPIRVVVPSRHRIAWQEEHVRRNRAARHDDCCLYGILEHLTVPMLLRDFLPD